jgi:1,4-alpha-glucan branching enzyme
VDNDKYLYHALGAFDKAMIDLINTVPGFNEQPVVPLWDKEGDQVLAYQRGKLVFVFNFNGTESFTDYGILAEKGSYTTVLNTDDFEFGGFNLVDNSIEHFTMSDPLEARDKGWLQLYIPARSAFVLKKK